MLNETVLVLLRHGDEAEAFGSLEFAVGFSRAFVIGMMGIMFPGTYQKRR